MNIVVEFAGNKKLIRVRAPENGYWVVFSVNNNEKNFLPEAFGKKYTIFEIGEVLYRSRSEEMKLFIEINDWIVTHNEDIDNELFKFYRDIYVPYWDSIAKQKIERWNNSSWFGKILLYFQGKKP